MEPLNRTKEPKLKAHYFNCFSVFFVFERMLLLKCKMQKKWNFVECPFCYCCCSSQKEAKQVSGMFSLHLPPLKLAEPNLFLHPFYYFRQQHLNLQGFKSTLSIIIKRKMY